MNTDASFEDGKLNIKRVFDAPIEQVFEAWMETGKVQQWWGCAQCTAVRSEIDRQVGGKYNHHMTIEGAGEVPGFATLVEYDPPNRLAYRSSNPGELDSEMIVTVDFHVVDGGTLVHLIHSGIPDMRVDGDMELKVIVQGGWTAAMEKLHGFLESEKQSAS